MPWRGSLVDVYFERMDETPLIGEWGEQDDQGVDIARLRYNLTLTDEQKIEQHRRAAEFVIECMRAADRAGVRRALV